MTITSSGFNYKLCAFIGTFLVFPYSTVMTVAKVAEISRCMLTWDKTHLLIYILLVCYVLCIAEGVREYGAKEDIWA